MVKIEKLKYGNKRRKNICFLFWKCFINFGVMEIFIEFYDIFIFEFFIIEVYWIVYIFCIGYGLSLEVKYS